MSKHKNNPFILILIAISWFIILPAIKTFFADIITPQIEYTLFEETENELGELIIEEDAVFPDEFIPLTSNWQSSSTEWTSNWHIYEPYLKRSILELENLDSDTIGITTPSSKKSGKKATKRQISIQDFWAGVYNIILLDNKERLNNLASSFLWFQEKNELSDREILQVIIDFIQQIPYEIPDNYYGLYSPTDVLYRNAGDCDSKSVLAALILKKLGYDTAIFYSDEYRHAMLGINVPSIGEYKELNGKSYYFTEMTASGWQIGEISPDCADLKYWHIISI